MWAYGHHFFTEYVDEGHITQDCGVEVVDFDQSSHASHCDENVIDGKLGYIGKIQEIMQVDFSSFQCVIFCSKWWDTFDRRNVKEYCDSEIIYINFKKYGLKVRSLMFSQNIATKSFFTEMCWMGIGDLY
jgi:hypothetical protein